MTQSELLPAVVSQSEGQQVMELFRRAFEGGGATPEALAQLVALKEKIDRRNAELEFAAAMTAFSGDCPAVPKTSKAEITTKSGGKFSYRYADFEQIVDTVRPHLQRHGLSFTFDSHTDGRMLTCTATLRHVNGHSVQASFTLPTDTASAMSVQQSYGAALTFAKRQCLVSILGLTITDPEADVDPTKLSEEQVATLRALLSEVDKDGKTLARLLALLGVDRLEDALARQYASAVSVLEAKRRKP